MQKLLDVKHNHRSQSKADSIFFPMTSRIWNEIIRLHDEVQIVCYLQCGIWAEFSQIELFFHLILEVISYDFKPSHFTAGKPRASERLPPLSPLTKAACSNLCSSDKFCLRKGKSFCDPCGFVQLLDLIASESFLKLPKFSSSSLLAHISLHSFCIKSLIHITVNIIKIRLWVYHANRRL